MPPGFVWGTGTSAYQVEGAWDQGGKGESIWDRFSHTPGKIKNGDTGDIACDHYHRFGQDIVLAKQLNLNSYRFSIAWPRVQPDGRGEFNSIGLDFYDRVIDCLLAKGITPFITLYHWDLPQHLEERGGWTNRETGLLFAQYTAKVVDRYSDRVKFWTTFNEPWCTSFLGYQAGVFAPGLKDEKKSAQVAHNLLLAHGLASQAARRAARQPIQVGIVLNLSPTEPLRPDNEEDRTLAEEGWRRDCGSYLDPLIAGTYPQSVIDKIGDFEKEDLKIINQKLDFLGINFYMRNVVSKLAKVHPIVGAQYTAMDWEVHPQSLRLLLNRISKDYNKPVLYVTENGAAFEDKLDTSGNISDALREQYIREHVQQCALAIEDGVDLRGYFAWSLMDNFEWAEGYSKRFGLIYVDYATQKRTIKQSGHWFARLAAANAIEM